MHPLELEHQDDPSELDNSYEETLSGHSPLSSDTSDDDDIAELSCRGLARFRERSVASDSNTMKETGIPDDEDTIAKFCAESLYSYSFSPIPHSRRFSQWRQHWMKRGRDYIRRIRWKLDVNLTSRRYSQPEMSVPEQLRLHTGHWTSQNTPRGSMDLDDTRQLHGADQNISSLDQSHSTFAPVSGKLIDSNDGRLYPIDEETDNSALTHHLANRTVRTMHAPLRFLPQNQAIITTSSDGTIALLNDIACLCFGIDKSFAGTSILDLLDHPFKQQISHVLQRRSCLSAAEYSAKKTSIDHVLVCGVLVPILKNTDVTSMASLWLKEKETDIGKRVYIWIFEEIYATSLTVTTDTKGIVTEVDSRLQELYGYDTEDVLQHPATTLIPYMSGSSGTVNVSAVERFYGSRTKSGKYFPVMVRVQPAGLDHYRLCITSLPTIAGLITVYAQSGKIQSMSPVPAKYLFGYTLDCIVNKMTVDQLIPQFFKIVHTLRQHNSLHPGSIVSHHTCRCALAEEDLENEYGLPLIWAVHRDSSRFEIQLQLRVLNDGEDLISIWVAYDRVRVLTQRNKRKVSTDGTSLHRSNANERKATRATSSDTALSDQISSVPRRRPLFQPYGFSSFRPDLTYLKTVDNVAHTMTHTAHEWDKDVPEVLREYVLLDTLGEGAHGKAQLACRKDDTSKKLVIKSIIKSRIIVDSWIRDRKLGLIPMEIHILQTLQEHSQVSCSALVSYLEDDDNYYVVMDEHGEGMNLFDYIELNDHITEREVRSIFKQVVAAVVHLHHLHIVHRDIKDENILLNENGTVRLIDFGSAAYFRQGRTFDNFSGTLDYCAPEILKGIPYDGPPQDVWSLGVLLYTLIYGETPFYNIDEILERDLRIPRIPFPEPMNLLCRMLDRNVDRRPTIDEIANDPWLAKD